MKKNACFFWLVIQLKEACIYSQFIKDILFKLRNRLASVKRKRACDKVIATFLLLSMALMRGGNDTFNRFEDNISIPPQLGGSSPTPAQKTTLTLRGELTPGLKEKQVTW